MLTIEQALLIPLSMSFLVAPRVVKLSDRKSVYWNAQLRRLSNHRLPVTMLLFDILSGATPSVRLRI